MAISTVQAVPTLGRTSGMGSHLEKHKTTGTSFLPTATAWDFSPPPPPPVLPGTTPHPRVVPAVVRMKRRANLHVDSFHATASSSPIPPPHLQSPSLPIVQSHHPLFTTHLHPFSIPEGPVTKKSQE